MLQLLRLHFCNQVSTLWMALALGCFGCLAVPIQAQPQTDSIATPYKFAVGVYIMPVIGHPFGRAIAFGPVGHLHLGRRFYLTTSAHWGSSFGALTGEGGNYTLHYIDFIGLDVVARKQFGRFFFLTGGLLTQYINGTTQNTASGMAGHHITKRTEIYNENHLFSRHTFGFRVPLAKRLVAELEPGFNFPIVSKTTNQSGAFSIFVNVNVLYIIGR